MQHPVAVSYSMSDGFRLVGRPVAVRPKSLYIAHAIIVAPQ